MSVKIHKIHLYYLDKRLPKTVTVRTKKNTGTMHESEHVNRQHIEWKPEQPISPVRIKLDVARQLTRIGMKHIEYYYVVVEVREGREPKFRTMTKKIMVAA